MSIAHLMASGKPEFTRRPSDKNVLRLSSLRQNNASLAGEIMRVRQRRVRVRRPPRLVLWNKLTLNTTHWTKHLENIARPARKTRRRCSLYRQHTGYSSSRKYCETTKHVAAVLSADNTQDAAVVERGHKTRRRCLLCRQYTG